MKTKTISIYKMLKYDEAKVELVKKIEFKRPVRIAAVCGTISSFPTLHVQLTLRLKEHENGGWVHQFKEDDNIIAVMNCGDSAVGRLALAPIDIVTNVVYFYYWAHNMTHLFVSNLPIIGWIIKRFMKQITWKDFHGSYIIFYEEIGE